MQNVGFLMTRLICCPTFQPSWYCNRVVNTMGSRHCFLRIADTAYRMKTVLHYQYVIRWASYLQKVRIQFPFALRKGNEVTEKSMKHIHADTCARAHILMQRYTLNGPMKNCRHINKHDSSIFIRYAAITKIQSADRIF